MLENDGVVGCFGEGGLLGGAGSWGWSADGLMVAELVEAKGNR